MATIVESSESLLFEYAAVRIARMKEQVAMRRITGGTARGQLTGASMSALGALSDCGEPAAATTDRRVYDDERPPRVPSLSSDRSRRRSWAIRRALARK